MRSMNVLPLWFQSCHFTRLPPFTNACARTPARPRAPGMATDTLAMPCAKRSPPRESRVPLGSAGPSLGAWDDMPAKPVSIHCPGCTVGRAAAASMAARCSAESSVRCARGPMPWVRKPRTFCVPPSRKRSEMKDRGPSAEAPAPAGTAVRERGTMAPTPPDTPSASPMRDQSVACHPNSACCLMERACPGRRPDSSVLRRSAWPCIGASSWSRWSTAQV
mmetsp:Transcript_4906/g.16364  ORF Transcript_4906/g.16364 Transcript_4906/m.16364 type:complete len:220 (+) Transcript_4906:1241-1900(+)